MAIVYLSTQYSLGATIVLVMSGVGEYSKGDSFEEYETLEDKFALPKAGKDRNGSKDDTRRITTNLQRGAAKNRLSNKHSR